MTKKEFIIDEVELGGYAEWEQVVKEVTKIKNKYPEAKDFYIAASPYYDDAVNRIEFMRYKTEQECRADELRKKRAEDSERQQYLKLKAKFENKGNG